jgi:hypothetical protein
MTDDRKFLRLGVIAPVLIILFAIFLLPGASLYYSYSGGKSCTKCHEIWQPYRDWHESAHRNIACSECHGDVLTLTLAFISRTFANWPRILGAKFPKRFASRGTTSSRSRSAAPSAMVKNTQAGPRGRTASPTRRSS